MTALHEYERLEATGLWRADGAAQRREVVVSLGDATLTIADMQDRVLGHWSLAAIERASAKGDRPAIYHPDGDPNETLELAEGEEQMIDALDRILRAVDRSRPQPGKLRHILAGVSAVAIVGLAVFWLPGALLSYSGKVVPPVKRAEIGTALLDRISRVSGSPCAAPEAKEPLRKLAARILGPQRSNALVVLPDGVATTTHLPGGRILLNRALVEDPEDADVPAGYILAEAVRAAASDPLQDLLEHAGLWASLKLLTTGSLPDSALDSYAEHVMVQPNAPVDPQLLIAAFSAAELRSSPYAYAIDVTGETTLALIEADPRATDGSRQVLADGDWIRLQGICGN